MSKFPVNTNLPLALWLAFLEGGILGSAHPQAPSSPAAFALANQQVRFVFEKPTMGLLAMVDRETGVNHFKAVDPKTSPAPATLWKLTFRTPDGSSETETTLANTEAPCSSAHLFLVNYKNEDSVFEWKLNPSQYGLRAARAGYSVARIDADGKRFAEEVSSDQTIQRREILGPWEIRLLEVRLD